MVAARNPRWGLVVASLLYVVIGLLLTRPLAWHMNDMLPVDVRDPRLGAWVLWWNAHRLPFTDAWWNAPSFYPAAGTLALSEHLLGLAPLTTPLQWLGASPVLAFNIAFALASPLCAIAAHALVLRLTGRHDAGLVAGLAFGFNPYRAAQLGHLTMLSSYWVPIGLLGLHTYALDRRLRWILLTAGAWLMQGLTNGYYLLFVPVLYAFWLFWAVPRTISWRQFATAAATCSAAALLLIPLAAGYLRIHDRYGVQQPFEGIAGSGAHPGSFLSMSELLLLWRSPIASIEPDKQLFPGLTLVALVALGILRSITVHRTDPTPRSRSRANRVALAIAGGSGIWTLVTLAAGDRAAGMQAAMLFRTDVALAALWYSLLAAGLTTSIVKRALREQWVLAFYVLAAGAMLLLAFGPAPTLRGTPFWAGAPYQGLLALPPYRSIRVPARFGGLMMVCLSVAAGLSFAQLVSRTSQRRVLFTALVAAGLLADGWVRDLPLHAVPQLTEALRNAPARPAAVLQLPAGDENVDAGVVYATTSLSVPSVNGYTGLFPPHYAPLVAGLDDRDQAVLQTLSEYGPLAIIVRREEDPDGRWQHYVAAHNGHPSHRIRSRAPRLLARQGAPHRALTDGPGLPLRDVTVSGRSQLSAVTDGDPQTGWRSDGPQTGGEEVAIDLGRRVAVSGVCLWLGTRTNEFPRGLIIELSEEGATWVPAWTGRGAAAAFDAALSDPLQTRAVITFAPSTARFIRLRQTDRARPRWFIGELQVLPG